MLSKISIIFSILLFFVFFSSGIALAGGCVCGANGGDRCNDVTYPDGTVHLVCDNSDAGNTGGGCCAMCGNSCEEGGGGGGSTCPGPANCSATNTVDPVNYVDHYVGENHIPYSCDLGNAASQYEVIDDWGRTWYRRVHSCCVSGSEVACHEETGGTYTVLRDNTNYLACGEERDIYVSTNTNTGIVRNGPYRECNEDGCHMVTEYWWQTTCIDVYDSCACAPVCSAGTVPTLSLPAEGSIYSGPSGGASVAFDWEAPSSWGTEASGTDRSYTLCAGTNSSDPCNGGQTFSVGTGSNPDSTTTQTITAGNKYWGVKANNTCSSASALSTIRNICIEGNTLPGDAGVGNAYYSQWSACNPNTHKRTRTCTEDCGTDNCTAAAAAGLLEEDCIADIRGTLFDATNLVSCPSFDPNTGYLIGVDTTLTANNRTFDMADQSAVPTHPWSLITSPETDSSGNYSVRVYAPSTYTYDFTDLKDMYVVSNGPKLTCTSAAAVVPGSATNCGTQPCTTVNNISFGFERYWGGWWQVQGAGVHAETGLRSSIPSALVSEQSLILPEPAMGNRRGIASYGIASDTMLGVNTNAKVSTSLWEALSGYDGVIYDYAYFNQHFKKNFTTAWDGVSAISYDDGGRGYQIFKVSGSVSDFNYNPTGTQKVIFLVNGDVTINSNITVPNGAFLAVLSSGTINFGTAVTNADGWYLADSIAIRCIDANSDSDCDRVDTQFEGNGSFVAWESIILSRDRGGDANILGPSEKFNYRLDLYNNAPDPMKIFTKKYKPYVP